MDSSLEGQYANDDATKLVELASKCLQFEARERPEIKFLLTAVAPLQRQKEVWFLFLLSMLTFNLHLLFFYLHSSPTVFNFIFLVSFSLSKIFVHHFEFAPSWVGLFREGICFLHSHYCILHLSLHSKMQWEVNDAIVRV